MKYYTLKPPGHPEVSLDLDILFKCFWRLVDENPEVEKKLEGIILDEILDVSQEDYVE